MIDNFNIIKDLLVFPKGKDCYYFAQIIVRRKDFCTGRIHMRESRVIKSYYINSLEYLEERYEEMKKLCDLFQARLYISLNPCSYQKTTTLLLVEIAQALMADHQRGITRAVDSISGKHKTKIDGYLKTWVVDIDSKDTELIKGIMIYINEECSPGGIKTLALIPTKQGYHLITVPFDRKKFNSRYSDVIIQKNSPTLLYCNIPTVN